MPRAPKRAGDKLEAFKVRVSPRGTSKGVGESNRPRTLRHVDALQEVPSCPHTEEEQLAQVVDAPAEASASVDLGDIKHQLRQVWDKLDEYEPRTVFCAWSREIYDKLKEVRDKLDAQLAEAEAKAKAKAMAYG